MKLPGLLKNSLNLSVMAALGFVTYSSLSTAADQKLSLMSLPNANVSLSTVSASNYAASQQRVDSICYQIEKKLGSVKPNDCVGRGFEEADGFSVNGLPIIERDFGPLNGREPLSRVLVIGGIHGDEYSSVSIVFKFMKKLEQHHSGLFHWKLAPLMNPDGLLQKKSQRMNVRGVDLNRNFPTPNWHEESHHYWVKRTKKNPRRYPGPAPLSEPESQWLAKTIAEFQPDVIVSIHAPFGILDFDGPKQKAPKRFGELHLNLLGTYPGSLGNYAGVHKEIPVVTIELPYAGIMPSSKETRDIWVDLVRWLIDNSKEEPAATQVKITANDGGLDPS